MNQANNKLRLLTYFGWLLVGGVLAIYLGDLYLGIPIRFEYWDYQDVIVFFASFVGSGAILFIIYWLINMFYFQNRTYKSWGGLFFWIGILCGCIAFFGDIEPLGVLGVLSIAIALVLKIMGRAESQKNFNAANIEIPTSIPPKISGWSYLLLAAAVLFLVISFLCLHTVITFGHEPTAMVPIALTGALFAPISFFFYLGFSFTLTRVLTDPKLKLKVVISRFLYPLLLYVSLYLYLQILFYYYY